MNNLNQGDDPPISVAADLQPAARKSSSIDEWTQPVVDRQAQSLPAPGELLRSAADVFRVSEASTEQQILLQDVLSNQVRICTAQQLMAALERGVVSRVHSLSGVSSAVRSAFAAGSDEVISDLPESMRSQKAQEVFVKKHRWIKRLKAHGLRAFRPGPQIRMAIREVEHSSGEKCPFEEDTLYRAWLTLRKNGGSARSIFPKFHMRGGRGGHRLQDETETIISNILEIVAQDKEVVPRPSKLLDRVKEQIQTSNKHRPADEALVPPSLPTITRRMNERFSAYEIAVRKYGEKRAMREFRESEPRIRAAHALDIVQYDDTDTCLYLIDGESLIPWGRCWLTAGVDEWSQVPLGKEISESSRSVVSAISAFLNGVFPKNPDASEFAKCRNRWEAYGHHGIALLDNASYNGSESFETTVLSFDTEVQYARPRHPTDKPDIEGFNHILKSDFICNLPGWSGPKEDRELLDEGIGTAIMTVSEFRQQFNRWLLDDYMNKPRASGFSPRELWRRDFEVQPPRLPKRQPSQELMLTTLSTLTLRSSGGLLRKGLRYNSEALADLRRRIGATAAVKVRISPFDLSYIYVEDPTTGHYLKVQCSERNYAHGLTDHQQTLILKRHRERKASPPNLEEMIEARNALSADVRQLAQSKKMTERKRAARMVHAGVNSDPVSASKPATETVVMSDLEALMDRIGEVELDEVDP